MAANTRAHQGLGDKHLRQALAAELGDL